MKTNAANVEGLNVGLSIELVSPSRVQARSLKCVAAWRGMRNCREQIVLFLGELVPASSFPPPGLVDLMSRAIHLLLYDQC